MGLWKLQVQSISAEYLQSKQSFSPLASLCKDPETLINPAWHLTSSLVYEHEVPGPGYQNCNQAMRVGKLAEHAVPLHSRQWTNRLTWIASWELVLPVPLQTHPLILFRQGWHLLLQDHSHNQVLLSQAPPSERPSHLPLSHLAMSTPPSRTGSNPISCRSDPRIIMAFSDMIKMPLGRKWAVGWALESWPVFWWVWGMKESVFSFKWKA